MTPTAHEIANAAWIDDEPVPVAWASGPWELQLRGDELADISFDGEPVLRSIRAVARDRDWGTVPSVVTAIEPTSNGLAIDIAMRGLGGEFTARIDVVADTTSMTVDLALVAVTEFWRNRIGLVVLHPQSVAESPLTVVDQAGRATETEFPGQISPHQPAFDIASLAWTAGGIRSTLEFRGDSFEMEDQRNWSDASFKTYSTPLALPFPVYIAAGTRIEQSITLKSERIGESDRATADTAIAMVSAGRPAPSITESASSEPGQVPPGFTLEAGGVLVELEVATGTWRAALERAVQEAGPAALDVRIVARSASDVELALDALAGIHLARLGVFSPISHVTEPELWLALVNGTAERQIVADLVGGTRGHFTELNRNHETIPADLPALTFSMTPQMHTTSRHQLVESIATQRIIAENAVRIAHGRPIHIGPITLRARFKAVATSDASADGDRSDDVTASDVSGDDPSDLGGGYGAAGMPGSTDSRQSSEALVAWTVASAAPCRSRVSRASATSKPGVRVARRAIIRFPLQQLFTGSTSWPAESSSSR